MNNPNLIYGVSDKPRKLREWIMYSAQQACSVLTATLLIAQICGTPYSSCLLGACLGTILYQIITKFRSPIFLSSCGATCSAVIGALALPSVSGKNYLMVACGGLIVALVYFAFAMLVKFGGIDKFNKLFPATIIGPITMVIGLKLAAFNVTYTHNSNTWEVIVAIATMLVIAVASHYFKGFWKTIPFLIGLVFGYIVSIILTITGVAELVDFSVFNPSIGMDGTGWHWYPDLTFLKWNLDDFSWSNLGQVALLFIPVAICALLEHYSDHKCLSGMIGTDLTVNPGLHKTLIGDGAASLLGTIVCGLPNTSFGESLACVGFSRVASVFVITVAALILGVMSFIAPVSALIASIPSCCFSGCALILYGFISASGLKLMMNNKVDLDNQKNLIITSVVLCAGVGGIFLFSESFAGVSLAMVLGIILNLILRDKKTNSK